MTQGEKKKEAKPYDLLKGAGTRSIDSIKYTDNLEKVSMEQERKTKETKKKVS
jgi:hypothetical protein